MGGPLYPTLRLGRPDRRRGHECPGFRACRWRQGTQARRRGPRKADPSATRCIHGAGTAIHALAERADANGRRAVSDGYMAISGHDAHRIAATAIPCERPSRGHSVDAIRRNNRHLWPLLNWSSAAGRRRIVRTGHSCLKSPADHVRPNWTEGKRTPSFCVERPPDIIPYGKGLPGKDSCSGLSRIRRRSPWSGAREEIVGSGPVNVTPSAALPESSERCVFKPPSVKTIEFGRWCIDRT